MDFGWNQVGVSPKHPACNLIEDVTPDLNRCKWSTVQQDFFKNRDCYSLTVFFIFSQTVKYKNSKTILLDTYYPTEHYVNT